IFQKRQWILLIMEFFLELLFTVILLILRNSVSTKHMDKLVFAKQSINTLPSYFLNTNKQRNWELVYVPSNSEAVNNLIEMVQQTLSNKLKIHGFTSEKDFEEYIKYDKNSDHVMAAIVFDHDFVHSEDPLPLEVRYHLRFSYLLRNTSRSTRLLVIPKEDHGWCTDRLFPVYLSQGPRNPLEPDGGVPGYIREGFLAVQHAVDKAIMKYHAKEASAEIVKHTTVFIKRFPFPAFLDDNFLTYLSQIWPPMILFIFSLTVLTILHTIVQEKETKLKVFKMGNTVKEAVRNLTLNLYEGQITALLGDNGAGKTTALSMLTGLFPPTSGKACIYGFEITKDMFHIRKSLGFCPQHDLLFDYLTVFEHLYFFAQLKALPPDICTKEINNILDVFKMGDKKHSFPKTLSGGMKRKLSISIALVGNSKSCDFVIEIEVDPTFGHVFEHEGWAYNAGWGDCQNEITLVIRGRFEALFTELETHGVKLGIASFGASVTTMEEVFLQVSKLADSSMNFTANQLSSMFDSKEVETERTVDDKQQSDSLMPQDLSNIQFNTGIPLCIQQFYALLLKRALYTFRHWRVMLLQILILLIFTAFVLKAILYYSEVKDAPVLELNLQQYGQSFVPFSISGEREVAGRFAERMRFMLRSENHILQLVSGNVEDFLLRTKRCSQQCIVAFNLEVYRSRTIITALFNNQAYHAAPIALTVVDNIMYKFISGPTASISVFNKPQPRTVNQRVKEQFLEGIKGHDIAFSLFFSVAFMASSFSLLTVSERVCKAKHIQFVSGAYIGIFWLSALFWDFIVFLVSSSLLLVVFYVCNVKAFLEDNHYVDVLFILMLFGWSTIPLIYLMSFMFSSSAAAYTRLLIFNVLTGISSFFLVYMIDANDIKYEENYYGFQGHGIGKYVIAMIVTGFLFLILLFLIEAYLWTCKSLCCNFLYGCFFRKQKRIYFHCVPVVAVDKLTFKVNKGECFGLLGFNGAGKSSTLKMLTGDETITSGEAIIDGRNILTKMTEIRQRISYCPAHNPLLEHLTGYEMLTLHAHLRGVPKQYIPAYVKNIIRALLLDAFADELIKNYSGGTKRKLSTGIALLGRPDIIFLDKPSSGMDPVARRFLWDIVLRTRESGKAIVLTSHSMEECEALCSRLAIMVNGKFKCLGSPRYLKNKCGSGYTLLAKTKRHKQAEMQELKTFIKTIFPGTGAQAQPSQSSFC
ncbi:ATP-binding cassette sub-family A member 3, partial [Sciurus carolinensis]|nr:ATP-binding cassette sub-family A member 3 [Sciurus carolinensis]